ncbi:Protein of unknown function [Malonomonas rubra DSM 5091]|uniref:Uncharacterized protein n=1 Tax=Malonomonas rubra DSM 5091 TaxID=1122189 RepID=A0A1M6H5G2_MALRU|nr:DUF3562 domain-containing protein [Malonomonas rubra]SHJ17362.1 Protein of unknown function [Malonomonas rubra DSM 5091]
MGHIDFQDDIEKNQHEEAINRLCEQFPGQQDQVRKNYLANLEPMIADASIRTYLPIFVSRKVKDYLEHH